MLTTAPDIVVKGPCVAGLLWDDGMLTQEELQRPMPVGIAHALGDVRVKPAAGGLLQHTPIMSFKLHETAKDATSQSSLILGNQLQCSEESLTNLRVKVLARWLHAFAGGVGVHVLQAKEPRVG